MWTKDNPNIVSFLKEKSRIPQCEVVPLTGDASARKYFRVIDAQKNNFVLMAWEPFNKERYPFFNVLHHFKKHHVMVPEVHSFDEALGLVLLEDLGDISLEQIFLNSSSEGDFKNYQTYYEQALSELIKIHFKASKDKSPCIAFDLDFDIEKLSWELNYTRTHLFENYLKFKFSDTQAKVFNDSIYFICKTLHEQPKYIQHRDYHSRNLMIKNGVVRVIDFQDARMGPIQYDLVSLFKDSYVEFPPYLETHYLKQYFSEALSHGYPITSYEEFLKIYNMQAVQRCLKACGSFASFFVLKNDSRYLKYLPSTLIKVRELLGNMPELKDFSDLILQTGIYNH